MTPFLKLSGILLLGTLVVRLTDPDGQLMVSSELYVLDVQSGHSITHLVKDGTTTLQLPAGDYRLYASRRIERGDFTDRYTTPEARIRLEDSDYENLILSARRYDNPEAASEEALLKKLNLEKEIIVSLK